MRYALEGVLILLLALLLAAPATGSAVTDADASGICERCHHSQTALRATTNGHAPGIECVTCHGLGRSGVFGPGHRSIPVGCTSHHQTAPEVHPVPSRPGSAETTQRRCLKCHDVHGSSNAHLVRTRVRVRGRLRQITNLVDLEHPGRGLCEVCHRDTRFYRANGGGEPHFTSDCPSCHDHEAAFAPVATDDTCSTCHAAEADRLDGPSLHHDRFAGACSSCHAEVNPTPGPGHRATAACQDCHAPSVATTHAPGVPIACTGCHEPHGTGNRRLIRDVLRTVPGGQDQPVRFDSFAGRADGSFASATDPGSGLCEICHTATKFYRADASGSPHYTTTCTSCHPHAAGFFPR